MANDQEDIAQAAEAEERCTPGEDNQARVPEANGETELPIETKVANTPASPEDSPMLDIHAPHEGIHTWKQYLLHMSTVVLGILIAIGLEQSVEATHRLHQRAELRESLHREAEEAIRAAKSSEEIDIPATDWLDARRMLVEDALARHQVISAPLPKKPHVDSIQPADPAWNAAKSSGLISLLSQDEVEVYSLADQLMVASQASFAEGVNAAQKRGQFEFEHSPGDGEMDLSKATPAELEHYREVLADEATAWNQYRVLCEYVRGVETAISEGERNIDKVQQAKAHFYRRVVK